jgi:hypothetical protein
VLGLVLLAVQHVHEISPLDVGPAQHSARSQMSAQPNQHTAKVLCGDCCR